MENTDITVSRKGVLNLKDVAPIIASRASSGDTLLESDPQLYVSVVRQLAEGKSVARTAKESGLSPVTVSTIKRREAETLGHLDEQMQEGLGIASEAAIESVIERLQAGDLTDKNLVFLLSVLVDKYQAMRGRPTAIIGHQKAVDVVSVRDLIDALPHAEVVKC